VTQLPPAAQVALIVGALILLAASALAAERLTLPLLKLLEGYWSRPAWLFAQLVRYRRWRRGRWATVASDLSIKQSRGDLSLGEARELAALSAVELPSSGELARIEELEELRSHFTSREFAKLGRASQFLRGSPIGDVLGMPTRLGDVLRAAEQRPYEKYGLDTVVCWYRLWMLLPADVKQEISEVRLQLDRAARTWLWGLLFVVWTPWLWWVAVPVGLLVAFLTYNVGILSSARLFGDLTDTAFDLYRMELYDALGLPRPASPAQERASGLRLSRMLWHGGADSSIAYVAPAKLA